MNMVGLEIFLDCEELKQLGLNKEDIEGYLDFYAENYCQEVIMPLYDYKCKVCDTVQEKQHKMTESNEEPCSKCNAPPKELIKQLSAIQPHVSWSLWKVGHG
jgi:putative FmdB family regulatory protein